MKKIKNLLLVIIIMIFVSMINVNAASVSVKSVKMIDHTGNATELSEAKPDGLNIKFDLSFSNVGDTAKYEVILNNPTNKEYEINTDKQFSGSNYISYSYELKDKTNRIKANSEVVLYITVKYENAVPADKLVDGKYVENNDMGINLLNEDNPNTFNNILLLIIMLIILIGITIIMIKSRNRRLSIIVIALLLVPVTVFALEKLKLTVSTKITIEESAQEKYNVYYYYKSPVKVSDIENNSDILKCNNNTYGVVQSDESLVDYKMCDFLVKDSKSYALGDRVEVENSPINYLDLDDCNFDGEIGKYICSIDAIETFSYHVSYGYSCGREEGVSHFTRGRIVEEESYGIQMLYYNVCDLDEFNGMNFSTHEDSDWDYDLGYVMFYSPNQFTMPAHDVYIRKYLTFSA